MNAAGFTDALYSMLCEQEGDTLAGLWLVTDWDERKQTIPKEIATFEYRKEVFLWALERLLREGRLKLAKHGKFLEGTVEEQVEAFRRAWPESELDADKRSLLPGDPHIGSGVGMGLWFFMDDCPAEAAWRQPDGSYRPA